MIMCVSRHVGWGVGGGGRLYNAILRTVYFEEFNRHHSLHWTHDKKYHTYILNCLSDVARYA